MEVIQPGWADLEVLVGSAAAELTIVTPFYTDDGVSRIFDRLSQAATLRVITRLSAPDWAAGVADPESLYALLDLTRGRHELLIVRNLHAKVYVADRHTALVGSSNLTWGGFGRNVEIGVKVQGSDAGGVLDATMLACRAGRGLGVDDLQGWIERSRPSVNLAKGQASATPDVLAGAQADLDGILGFGGSTSRLPDPEMELLERFVDWLRRHSALAGAAMIIRRYDNLDGHNLQGHTKQTFFGAVRFCAEYPGLQAELARALTTLGSDEIYQLSPDVADAWNRHLDDHALDSGAAWSYAILRGQLPVSLGGSVATGGGASSTLKRILPLVAEYLAVTQSGGAKT